MGIERYSISVHFAQAAIHSARLCQLNEVAILTEAGISPRLLDNVHLRITPEQFSRLMRSLWREADDEFMGLTGQRCRNGVFAMMAKQAVRCRTLGAVYHHLSRFYNLINDSVQLRLETQGPLARFSMNLSDPDRDNRFLLRDFFLLLWHRFPSWLIGQRIPLHQVAFEFPAPEHQAEYRLMFPCPARFEETSNQLIFDTALLDAPVIQTPETLRAHLQRAPLDWFTRQAYYQVYTRRVMDYLELPGHLAAADITSTAQALHMTERTLRRKLLLEGTRFQTLKESMRRDLALHYLNQPSLPIARIAQQLGFSEASAFTRAFKQWTGESPKTYRDAVLDREAKTTERPSSFSL